MPKMTVEKITDVIGGEMRVKEIWLKDNADKFDSVEALEEGWKIHRQKVNAFLNLLAQHTEPIIFKL